MAVKCNNCGQGTKGVKGEPGIQGAKGDRGPSGGLSTVDYYSANAAGIQSTATQLGSTDNIVNVGLLNSAVKLPVATKNASLKVTNATAVNIRVYPFSGDQIGTLGVNVFDVLGPGAVRTYKCPVDGTFLN